MVQRICAYNFEQVIFMLSTRVSGHLIRLKWNYYLLFKEFNQNLWALQWEKVSMK